MDPLQLIAQLMPQAQNEDQLLSLLAAQAPPPPVDFRPQGMPMAPPGKAVAMQAPQRPGIGPALAGPGAGPGMVPPMTLGESRTAPRLGNILLGG